jgi:hypothetical protein
MDVAFALFALFSLAGALIICIAIAGTIIAIFDLDK